MDIALTERLIKAIYIVLIGVYKKSDNPICSGFPRVDDLNTSMLRVCIQRPYNAFGTKILYPHVLHKASVFMQSIVTFHPFIDGNKRMSLLCTSYYLHVNGYMFKIPPNADEFVIKIATDDLDINTIFNWLIKYTTRTPITTFGHLQYKFILGNKSQFLFLLFEKIQTVFNKIFVILPSKKKLRKMQAF